MLDPITQSPCSIPIPLQCKGLWTKARVSLHHPLPPESIPHPVVIQWSTLHSPTSFSICPRNKGPGVQLSQNLSSGLGPTPRQPPCYFPQVMALNRYLSAFSVVPQPPAPPIKGSSVRGGHMSQPTRKGREREAVIEHLSGLIGEAEQEGGWRRKEPCSGREPRGTRDPRPRGPDPARPAWAARALRGYKAFRLLRSWRASPSDRVMES